MAVPVIVGVGAGASGIGAVTAPLPAGYTAVADDIWVTFCECESADAVTAPFGWAIVTNSVCASGTTTELTAIWHRAAVGDTAPSIADVGNHLGTRMIVLRYCVTSGNPWDIFATAQELTADTSVSIPGLTTAVADCLVLAAFSTGQDTASVAGATGWANASLANVTERMDNWVTDGLGGGFAMASGEKAVAGVVSATTATLSLTANFKALMSVAMMGATQVQPSLAMARSR